MPAGRRRCTCAKIFKQYLVGTIASRDERGRSEISVELEVRSNDRWGFSGAKAPESSTLYAALKRRSSTVVSAENMMGSTSTTRSRQRAGAPVPHEPVAEIPARFLVLSAGMGSSTAQDDSAKRFECAECSAT